SLSLFCDRRDEKRLRRRRRAKERALQQEAASQSTDAASKPANEAANEAANEVTEAEPMMPAKANAAVSAVRGALKRKTVATSPAGLALKQLLQAPVSKADENGNGGNGLNTVGERRDDDRHDDDDPMVLGGHKEQPQS